MLSDSCRNGILNCRSQASAQIENRTTSVPLHDPPNGRSVAAKERISPGRVLPSHANQARSPKSDHRCRARVGSNHYHMLKTREAYEESVFASAEIRQRQQTENRLRSMARPLGYTLASSRRMRPPFKLEFLGSRARLPFTSQASS